MFFHTATLTILFGLTIGAPIWKGMSFENVNMAPSQLRNLYKDPKLSRFMWMNHPLQNSPLKAAFGHANVQATFNLNGQTVSNVVSKINDISTSPRSYNIWKALALRLTPGQPCCIGLCTSFCMCCPDPHRWLNIWPFSKQMVIAFFLYLVISCHLSVTFLFDYTASQYSILDY